MVVSFTFCANCLRKQEGEDSGVAKVCCLGIKFVCRRVSDGEFCQETFLHRWVLVFVGVLLDLTGMRLDCSHVSLLVVVVVHFGSSVASSSDDNDR